MEKAKKSITDAKRDRKALQFHHMKITCVTPKKSLEA